ncbi:MAG: methyltransferase [Selenomonadaceae bacterium]|nr:methyltransferase [Selenomonadaceae bacterium]
MDALRENETLDDLGGGRKIIQARDEFRFSLDAVLLANFVRLRPNCRDDIADLGTGTGILPLLLADKIKSAAAIELRENQAEMAGRSVRLNGLEDRIRIITGDYCSRDVLNTAGRESFDVVVANPPYFGTEIGAANRQAGVNDARHETTATIGDVARAAAYLLKYGGRFSLIHVTDRLVEVMAALTAANLQPKQLRMVTARPGKAATLFLLEAKKGAKPGLKMMPELIVHGDCYGGYSREVAGYYTARYDKSPDV